MTDTRESLAKELAKERLEEAQENSMQGGCGMDHYRSLTLEGFMEEAYSFVDRCIAIGAKQ